MNFFVHEFGDEVEVFSSVKGWADAMKGDPRVPEELRRRIKLMFEEGQDKYHSASYGDFYMIDVPTPTVGGGIPAKRV